MKPKTILFVCTGNTCRSPIAEMILRHLLKKENIPGVKVISRGLNAWTGATISEGAKHALEAAGIPVIPHKTRLLEKEDLEKADLVLTMTEAHLQMIETSFPEAKAKTRRLGSEDIPDPVGGSPSDYEKCRIVIQNHLLDLIKTLK